MGLFRGDDDGSSKSTPVVCEPLPTPLSDTEPIVGSLTFKQLSLIIGGACLAFSCLVSLGITVLHATHYSNPAEQAKIIRIITIIPMFGVLTFLSIIAGHNATYVVPWIAFWESLTLATFFLLVCTFVSPNEGQRDIYFRSMTFRDKKGKGDIVPGGGLANLRKTWAAAFQYPIVSLLVAIVTCITEGVGVYCEQSNNIHFTHIWLQIIKTISVIVAVLAIIRFTMMMKSRLAEHKILRKLMVFKLIIALEVLQTLIFSFVKGRVTVSNKFSYDDISASLPSLILLVELALISPLFAIFYNHKQYIIGREVVELGNRAGPRASRYYGAGSALAQLVNWTEIIKGIAYGVKLMTSKEERDGGYLMASSEERQGSPHPALPYPEQQYPPPHHAGQQYPGPQYPEQQHLAPQYQAHDGAHGSRY